MTGTKEGLASAKAKGRNGGRPNKQNEKAGMVMALYDSGMKNHFDFEDLMAFGLFLLVLLTFVFTFCK